MVVRMKKDTKNFTAGVRRLVKSKTDTNQTAVANDLNIPLSTFNGWMNNHRNMPQKHMTKFMEYFGMTAEEIEDAGRKELGLSEPESDSNYKERYQEVRGMVEDLKERLATKDGLIADLKARVEMLQIRIAEMQREKISDR